MVSLKRLQMYLNTLFLEKESSLLLVNSQKIKPVLSDVYFSSQSGLKVN